MTNHTSGPSQTRSFSTVFLIEMWERFGYYGMAALLVLFMIDKLGFADDHANLIWGAFTALVYASPSIGGWIGDKVLGARRTMIDRRARSRGRLSDAGGADRHSSTSCMRRSA